MFGEEGTTGEQARCVPKTKDSDRTGEGRNFVRMSNFVLNAKSLRRRQYFERKIMLPQEQYFAGLR